jgi:hypothetical protein
MFASEHDKTKSAGAQQFVDGAQRVHAALRPHEQWTVFPERTGDRAGDVDPCSAVAVRDRGRTCGAHDRCRAAARFPHGQTAERKSSTGERAIELYDSRRDRIGGISRDLNGVWETLFEQDSEGGDLCRHGMKMIPNKHRSHKGQKALRLTVCLLATYPKFR